MVLTQNCLKFLKKGLVIKSTGSWYLVKDTNGNKYECRIRGKLRLDGIKSTNPIIVGDNVEFEIEDIEKNIGLIKNLCERKNYIIRKATNLSKRTHIIAANVDHAYLIVTIALPETSTEFIDRFLVSAEAYRIPVSLIFNKIDIFLKEHLEYMHKLVEIYEKIGYKCFEVSALNNINIDILRNKMKGKVNVVAGHSGVGKSTLINIIAPNAKLKVGELSEYHLKGKHTTTFAEMIEFNSGGYIIDTPGIKGFGVIDMEKEELYHFFPEIFKISKKCFYYNCTHIHEPNCAVLKAVENGNISISRYNSYLNLFHKEDNKHRI